MPDIDQAEAMQCPVRQQFVRLLLIGLGALAFVLAWKYKSQAVQDVLLAGLFVYAVMFRTKRWRAWFNAAGISVLTVLAFMLIQIPFGVQPQASLREMLKHADFALAALAIPVLFNSRRKLETLLLSAAMALTAVLAIDLVRLLAEYGTDVMAQARWRETQVLTHPNIAAISGGAALLVLTYGAWSNRRARLLAVPCVLGLLIDAAYIVVIASRGAQLALLVAVATVAFLMAPGKRVKYGVLVLALLCGLLLPRMNPRFANLLSREALVDRDKVWRHTWELIQQRPLLGYGFGEKVFMQVYHSSDAPASPHHFYHPHQYGLNVLFTSGWMGVVLQLVMWSLLALSLLKILLNARADMSQRLLAATILAVMLQIHIGGLVDCPTNIVALALQLTIPAAIAMTCGAHSGMRREVEQSGCRPGCADAVSVVIPLYNKEKEIERALASVKRQSMSPTAIIVVDDGSTDGSAQLVQALNDPLIRLIRQPNAGPSSARNRGISEAPTDLVALLDADDEWEPDFLKTALALQRRHPEAGLWGCAFKVKLESGAWAEPHRFPGAPRGAEGGIVKDFFRSSMKMPLVCCSGVLCCRAVLDMVGGFPEGVRLGEDFYVWIQIALRYPVAYTPLAQVIYHKEASNRAMQRERYLTRDTPLYRLLKQALDEKRFEHTSRRSLKLLLGTHLLEIARHAVAAGNAAFARELIREVWGYGVWHGRCIRRWLRSYRT